MTPVYARPTLELEFPGKPPVWVDVTRDVRADTPIRLEYGIQGTSPTDRVASTGTLTFSLDNSEANSQGPLGPCSPNPANVRAGFGLGIGVRLAITYDDVPRYKWRGTLDAIQPVPGIAGTRRVQCVAVDWMDEAAKARLVGLPTQ